MSEDILYRAQQEYPEATYSEAIFNKALIQIEDKLLTIEGKLLKEYGLPETSREEDHSFSQDTLRETSYNGE